MKNLDLNKYGVQEMNSKEMKTVDGGRVHWWQVLASAAAGFIVAGPAGAMVGAFAGVVASDQADLKQRR